MSVRFKTEYLRKHRPSAFREQATQRFDAGATNRCGGIEWALNVAMDAFAVKCGVPYEPGIPEKAYECLRIIGQDGSLETQVRATLEAYAEDYTLDQLKKRHDVDPCPELWNYLDKQAMRLGFSLQCPCTYSGPPYGEDPTKQVD